jgi:hypothetical protein
MSKYTYDCRSAVSSVFGFVLSALIADTGYELYAACETVRDLDQLYADLGMADEMQEDAMYSVCDPELSDAGQVWDGVVANSDEWLDQARVAM